MTLLFVLTFFVFLNPSITGLNTESFVNLKYLEREMKTSLDYRWENDEIIISKNGRQVRIFLNMPYIILDTYQKKIDTPPFTEKGVVYISQYTYEQVLSVLDEGVKKKTEEIQQEKIKEQEQEIKIEEQKTTEDKKEKTFIIRETPTLKKEMTPVKVVELTPTIVPTPFISSKKQTRVIVFDPGHGGNDPGAIGPNGVQEKDIVLDIAIRVIKYLKQENFKIYLTRKDDTFISLKNRAVFANEKDADLFISIHCNASKNKGAQGIRTYIYNRIASSKEAAEAAKLENKNVGTFELLLNDLRKSAFEYLSIEAAGNIQHCLVKNLRLKWAPTERAPFYVLANTNMPSVLVEAAFISNPQEEKKLDDNDFRERISKGIAEGILEYFSKLK